MSLSSQPHLQTDSHLASQSVTHSVPPLSKLSSSLRHLNLSASQSVRLANSQSFKSSSRRVLFAFSLSVSQQFGHPASQQVRQSNRELISHPAINPNGHPSSHIISRPVSQPDNQSVSYAFRHSVSQPVIQQFIEGDIDTQVNINKQMHRRKGKQTNAGTQIAKHRQTGRLIAWQRKRERERYVHTQKDTRPITKLS